jgi:hypothetical protein
LIFAQVEILVELLIEKEDLPKRERDFILQKFFLLLKTSTREISFIEILNLIMLFLMMMAMLYSLTLGFRKRVSLKLVMEQNLSVGLLLIWLLRC